jgi:hypothetical protein
MKLFAQPPLFAKIIDVLIFLHKYKQANNNGPNREGLEVLGPKMTK